MLEHIQLTCDLEKKKTMLGLTLHTNTWSQYGHGLNSLMSRSIVKCPLNSSL